MSWRSVRAVVAAFCPLAALAQFIVAPTTPAVGRGLAALAAAALATVAFTALRRRRSARR